MKTKVATSNYLQLLINSLLVIGLFIYYEVVNVLIVTPASWIGNHETAQDNLIKNGLAIGLISLFLVLSFLLAKQLGAFEKQPTTSVWRGALVGVILVAAVKLIFSTVHMGTPANQVKVLEQMTPLSLSANILFFGVLAPLLEELIFRFGLMGRVFQAQQLLGWVVSSLFFGWVHQSTLGLGMVFYSALGFAFGAPYFFTKRLESSIITHMLANLVSIILIYSL